MTSHNTTKKYGYTTVSAAVNAAVEHLEAGKGPSDACDAVLLATHPDVRGAMTDRVYAMAMRRESFRDGCRAICGFDPFEGVE